MTFSVPKLLMSAAGLAMGSGVGVAFGSGVLVAYAGMLVPVPLDQLLSVGSRSCSGLPLMVMLVLLFLFGVVLTPALAFGVGVALAACSARNC